MSFLIQQFNCQPQFQYGNPPDSIPLWVAAREDNTLSSRLTRPSHFPSVSFYYFTCIGIWPGSYQDYQIKNAPPKRCIFYSATSMIHNLAFTHVKLYQRPGYHYYGNSTNFWNRWLVSRNNKTLLLRQVFRRWWSNDKGLSLLPAIPL